MVSTTCSEIRTGSCLVLLKGGPENWATLGFSTTFLER
jgi:hypothetical protein